MARKMGFTLIELLVVVAVISILAAIAAANYSLATTKAKVAASRTDLRNLTLAMEAYVTDRNAYPPACGVGEYFNPIGPFAIPVSVRLFPLTTPVAYISQVPHERFPLRGSLGGQGSDVYDTYDYVQANAVAGSGAGLTSGGKWRIAGLGPDSYLCVGGVLAINGPKNERGVEYDATNGTSSVGDIVAVGPLDTESGNPLDPANLLRPGIVRVPQYFEQWQ